MKSKGGVYANIKLTVGASKGLVAYAHSDATGLWASAPHKVPAGC